MTTLNQEAVTDFKAQLRGQLLQPEDDGYDEARKIWNAMIDRRPAMILRCAGDADIRRGIRFAREQDMLLAVRGGGHNIAGNALCDGGIVLDLSAMRSIRVDPSARQAIVEGGATLADFDHEAQAFGLATPMGINSTTGVAGLTLGGGFGWLTHQYGLTVDNLVSADVITAQSEKIRASDSEHPDLFWAIRGGGGNFGVVSRFEFRLHPVGPDVFAGLIVFPFDEARKVLMQYRKFVDNMDDAVNLWAVLRKAPPLPFLPPEVHGKEVIALAAFSTLGEDEAQRVFEPVRGFGTPHGEHLGMVPYANWQKAFDPLLTPGARNYWKSHNFAGLSDEAVDAIVDYAGKLPGPECEIFLGSLGGQANRMPSEATAYPHRNVQYAMNVHTRWSDPADDQKCISWARDFFAATARHAAGSVYINFLTQDEGERIAEAYGKNYDRLVQVKNQYDPGNLFRQNHNIKPSGAAG